MQSILTSKIIILSLTIYFSQLEKGVAEEADISGGKRSTIETRLKTQQMLTHTTAQLQRNTST